MKRLEIHTEYARIGIETQPARMTINNNYRRFKAEYKAPEHEEVATQKAASFKMNVRQTGMGGDVVDLSPRFRNEARLLQNPQSAGTQAQSGNAAQGTQGAQGANAQAEQAKPSALPAQPSMAQAVLEAATERAATQADMLPQGPPSIEWDKGYTKINWAPYEFQIQWDEDYMPDFNVERHSVEIFLQNQPSITISVVDDGLMIQHGRNVDKQV